VPVDQSTTSYIFYWYHKKVSKVALELSLWEAASHSTTHEFSNILWYPHVYYHIHNSQPLVCILSHMNPVYTLTPCFFKIHCTGSHLCFCLRVVSGFLTKVVYAILIFLMQYPSHPTWVDYLNNMWWRVQSMMILIMQFSPAPVTFCLVGWNTALSTLFLNMLNLCSSLRAKGQVSYPYKGKVKL
jgi:hypothetical protein